MASLRFPEVGAALRGMLAQASDVGSFTGLLTRLLERPGRVLAADGPSKWPAFVLETSRALGGSPGAATMAAAAVELAVAAADVADDLVDDEWDAALGDRRRALNASFALLLLVQRCVARLEGLLGAPRACLIADMFARGGLAACAGQDLDMQFESPCDVDEEQAHDMTRRKSGSIVGMACQIGAAVATDDPRILNAACSFGTHIGIAAQLLNDLGGIDPARDARATDLRHRKKTLPVAYSLRCASEERLSSILSWYSRDESVVVGAEEDLALSLREIGAHQYTWIVADAHRREALTSLGELVRASGRKDAWRLRRLVPGLGGGRRRRYASA